MNIITDPSYADHSAFKTHLLPHHLVPADRAVPSIYIVRDGRDSLISMAHQRVDLLESEFGFEENLKRLIRKSENNQHFGNWTKNVTQWTERADLVIRYENLIHSPIETVEKFRAVIDLPELRTEEIPTFDQLRSGSENEITQALDVHNTKEQPQRLGHFFRRGIAGAWKDEMPDDLHELFWKQHKEMMVELGYTEGML